MLPGQQNASIYKRNSLHLNLNYPLKADGINYKNDGINHSETKSASEKMQHDLLVEANLSLLQSRTESVGLIAFVAHC